MKPPPTPAPTVLLVGFLGAGKTTLLRGLLPALAERGLNPCVFINDYQNARIDAASLRAEIAEVLPINGNCVCCDSLHELIDALLAIPDKPNRVVLIEANGTTDPCSLIEHLTVHGRLRERFAPLLQLAVIDAKRWQKRAWHNDLERLQAKTASHLVFTRTDTETGKRVAGVRHDLEGMNPMAQETDLVRFADELADLALAARPSDAKKNKFRRAPQFTLASSATPHRHALAHGFVAVQVDLPRRVRQGPFLDWLRSLPASVLRVKALVMLIELPNVWLIAQLTDDARREATMFPAEGNPAIPPCAVLIGVRLDAESIRRDAARIFGGEEAVAA